jgi:hypothetical protein
MSPLSFIRRPATNMKRPANHTCHEMFMFASLYKIPVVVGMAVHMARGDEEYELTLRQHTSTLPSANKQEAHCYTSYLLLRVNVKHMRIRTGVKR